MPDEFIGFNTIPEAAPIKPIARLCRVCNRPVGERHASDCPQAGDDPNWPRRVALGNCDRIGEPRQQRGERQPSEQVRQALEAVAIDADARGSAHVAMQLRSVARYAHGEDLERLRRLLR